MEKFKEDFHPAVQKVKALCDDLTKRLDPKMRWMWGEALFGYALFLWDDFTQKDNYMKFLTGYCDYYITHKPRVDYADTVAPALITYAMQKKTGNQAYEKLTNRVVDYIRNEPRILDDAVNHLGKSPESKFYPKSIWVDSLMMFSVFPALYGRENNDRALLDYAARQPQQYANYMQDRKTNLWYHSYWVKKGKAYPGKDIYWGRGNGWVMASLPMILEQIGLDHPNADEIKKLITQTANALLNYQQADGTFCTLIGKKSYKEMSATALIASGFLQSVRLGVLPQSHYREAGEKAFLAVSEKIIKKNDASIVLKDISAPTIPLQVAPKLCYKMTPKGENYSYGVAAISFAAIEFQKLQDQTNKI